ncbi:MAG: RNA 2',3'-cyclic phosphodiesterase [Deltaproteobacteria bacterium]|jgi:2'-5' RNA ligase|nr:RNA 2',3'-cyclic phosphodiesterase [Deltaproteobacteria bacterium]
MSETIRLFTAIEIPQAQFLALKNLSGHFPDANILPGGKAHITLRFFGEFEKSRLQDLSAALAKVKANPFEIHFSSLGTFKMSRSLVLWAGIRDNPALTSLYGLANEALHQGLGLISPASPYRPHVTLARVKQRDAKKIARALGSGPKNLGPQDSDPRVPGQQELGFKELGPQELGPQDSGPQAPGPPVLAPPFTVTEFGLYQSILGSGPARHVLLNAFPLQISA